MATITTVDQELLRFADLVERMMDAQLRYFKKGRHKTDFIDALNHEKLVRQDLARYKTGRLIP